MADKALAIIPDNFLTTLDTNPEAKGTATPEAVREAIGAGTPSLERWKVKHQGAAAFQDEDGNLVQRLEGVVVAFTYANSYFGVSFDEADEANRPKCFSNDGLNIAPNADDPQATSCAACPRNREAQDPALRAGAFELARDEACHNYLHLAIRLADRELPIVVRFPQTSFANWRKYAQRLFTAGRFEPHQVATRITLKDTKKGRNQVSVAQFEKLGALAEAHREAFAAMHRDYTALLQRTFQGADNASSEGSEALRKAREAAKSGQDAGL